MALRVRLPVGALVGPRARRRRLRAPVRRRRSVTAQPLPELLDARALSQDPARESVLILGHGPEDDAENERWLARIDARAAAVRDALPFRRVQVETLREDWPEKRADAEARIRAFVAEAGRDGGRAIVIPYRVAGFGPYASVLKDLTYVSDGKGLIPSVGVEQWVRRQVEALRSGPFRAPVPGG